MGKCQITDNKAKSELISAYYDGITGNNFQGACFNPRHGIRAIKDGKSLDLVICFGCGHVQVIDGKSEKYIGIGGIYAKRSFNKIVADYGLPQSERGKE